MYRPTLLHVVALGLALVLLGGCGGKAFTHVDYPRPVDPAAVKIVRDAYGVPHVIGHTDAEAAYGLAWASAEDHNELGQRMLAIIRARYAEIDGKDAAIYDYLVHALDADVTVDARYDADISPEFKRYLKAFTQGLNDYALTHPAGVRLPGLFPVTPRDIIRGHLIMHSVDAGLLPVLEDIFSGRIAEKQQSDSGQGSNGFAFAPRKTADGRTYLVLNPHLPIEDLFSLYEVHLYSDEGLNILGGLNPMSPCLPNGVTPNLGWMIPTSYTDGIDVYRLRMHPDDPLRYRFGDRWQTLEHKVVTLHVRLVGGLVVPVKKDVYKSIYGPTFLTPHGVYSVRIGTLMTVKLAEQFYRMSKASNLAEFRAALQMGAIARKNLIYADRDGNIMYHALGMIPQRASGLDWRGVLPGEDVRGLWTRFWPVRELVHVVNPACGWVANTNNTPFACTCAADAPQPPDPAVAVGIDYLTLQNNRGRRVAELLPAFGETIDWSELHRLKFDRTLPQDHSFRGLFAQLGRLDLSDRAELAALRERLLYWDGTADPESVGGAAFYVFSHVIYTRYGRTNPSRQALELGDDDLLSVLAETHRLMAASPKGLDSSLGELFVLTREKREFAFGGHRDTLAAAFGPPMNDGRFRYTYGDGFVLFAAFGKDGVQLETSTPFGASGDPDSPHYTDQMSLAAEQRTKTMSLDIEQVLNEAELIYAPGAGVEAALAKARAD